MFIILSIHHFRVNVSHKHKVLIVVDHFDWLILGSRVTLNPIYMESEHWSIQKVKVSVNNMAALSWLSTCALVLAIVYADNEDVSNKDVMRGVVKV